MSRRRDGEDVAEQEADEIDRRPLDHRGGDDAGRERRVVQQPENGIESDDLLLAEPQEQEGDHDGDEQHAEGDVELQRKAQAPRR